MIRKKQTAAGSLIALLLLASCVKEEIHNTSHPEHGRITLIADWSKRGEGISIPQNYSVEVGGYTATLSGNRNTIDNLFLPDTYRPLVFNTPEKITVKEATASVAATEAGYMDALPGWLFACATEVTIGKDREHAFTAVMEQQIRALNLWIEPTGGTVEKIASVTATLSGAAQQLNLRNGVLSVEKSIRLTFTKQADGKYKATARLQGFVSATPKLSVQIGFAGGVPAAIAQDYDLSSLLKTFNQEKNKPLSLGAQLIETPTGAGFTTALTDWKTVKEGNGTAD